MASDCCSALLEICLGPPPIAPGKYIKDDGSSLEIKGNHVTNYTYELTADDGSVSQGSVIYEKNGFLLMDQTTGKNQAYSPGQNYKLNTYTRRF